MGFHDVPSKCARLPDVPAAQTSLTERPRITLIRAAGLRPPSPGLEPNGPLRQSASGEQADGKYSQSTHGPASSSSGAASRPPASAAGTLLDSDGPGATRASASAHAATPRTSAVHRS